MTRCANCGAKDDERIDSEVTLQGTIIADPYCGACGVNWGVIAKRRNVTPVTPNKSTKERRPVNRARARS